MKMKVTMNDVFTIKAKSQLTDFLTIGEIVTATHDAEVKRGNKVINVRRENGSSVNVLACHLEPVPVKEVIPEPIECSFKNNTFG